MTGQDDTQIDPEAWWINYIEGEMDARHCAAMEALLRHSPTDRLVVENLERLKKSLKASDRLEVPTEESYHQELHLKIMNQIDAGPDGFHADAPSAVNEAYRRWFAP